MQHLGESPNTHMIDAASCIDRVAELFFRESLVQSAVPHELQYKVRSYERIKKLTHLRDKKREKGAMPATRKTQVSERPLHWYHS